MSVSAKGLLFYLIYAAILLLFLRIRFRYGKEEKQERRMLSEFLAFLGRFSTEYLSLKSVRDAFLQAEEDQERAIAKELSLMEELLSEEEADDFLLLDDYLENAKLPCFAEFAIAVKLTSAWGDLQRQGQSLLLQQVETIRRETRDRLLLLEEKKYEYAFEVPICLLPFFCLKPMEVWGKSLMSGMGRYYEGRFGAVATLTIFATVLLCFLVCFVCRFFGDFAMHRRKKQKGMEERVAFFLRIPKVKDLYIRYIYRDYARTLRKEDRLEEAGYGRRLPQFLEQKLASGFLVSIGVCFFGSLFFSPGFLLLPLLLLSFLFGYFLPEVYLVLLYLETKVRKKEERLRLLRILQLLKDHPQMRGERILHYLKHFSLQYHRDFEVMEDACLRKEELAEELSEQSKKELDFLLRAMKATDQVALSRAFEGIGPQLAFYEKKYEIETRKLYHDGAVLSRMLTFIPLFVTVGLYLILPFVAEGLGEIASYQVGFGGYV